MRLKEASSSYRFFKKNWRELFTPVFIFRLFARCQSTKALAAAAQGAHISFAIFGVARVFGVIAGFVTDLAIGAITAVHIHKHLLIFRFLMDTSAKNSQKITAAPTAARWN